MVVLFLQRNPETLPLHCDELFGNILVQSGCRIEGRWPVRWCVIVGLKHLFNFVYLSLKDKN